MRSRSLGAILLAMSLAACATTPPQTAAQPLSAERLRSKAGADGSATAAALQAQNRFREAMWWWRVAQTATPDARAPAAAIEVLQDQIDKSVVRLMAEADRMRRKGAAAEAQAAYQQVLWLDPSVTAAREALRSYDANAKLRAIARGGGGGPAATRTAD